MRFAAARGEERVDVARRLPHARGAADRHEDAIAAAIRAWSIVLVMLPLLAGPASGADVDWTGARFSLLPNGEHLALDDSGLIRAAAAAQTTTGQAATAQTAPASTDTAERQPNWLLTSVVVGGALVGSGLNSYFDGDHVPYHLGHEGWFGRDTHFGGADKAAHFVDYYLVSKEFAKLFVVLGHTPERARWLAAGTAALTGLVTEIGDGQNRYGFSYEDLVMDTGGALAAALIDIAGIEDLVGFRRGIVSFHECCDYSNEIFTGDFHLAGAARRLGVNIGPLKYLLLSVTYGTKGYPGNSGTQRQVGFEVGLDFRQMLDDINVRRDRWWGYALHVVFDNVRFPYTAVGYRYDMNHGRWHGPNAGD